jgi:hypothetical protein
MIEFLFGARLSFGSRIMTILLQFGYLKECCSLEFIVLTWHDIHAFHTATSPMPNTSSAIQCYWAKKKVSLPKCNPSKSQEELNYLGVEQIISKEEDRNTIDCNRVFENKAIISNTHYHIS